MREGSRLQEEKRRERTGARERGTLKRRRGRSKGGGKKMLNDERERQEGYFATRGEALQ